MNAGTYDFSSRLILQFLGWLSSLIYGMVAIVTQGFFNLAYIEIFNSSTVSEITARLYVVLAVFMIFKLAFSLIQYLVNPEQVSDKQAGMGKLVGRTATAFIMLIGVPIIFKEFVFGPPGATPNNSYQAIIARAIPRIIIGSDGVSNDENSDQSDTSRSMGETMAAVAFSAFVQPRKECNAPSLDKATISDIADKTYVRCSDVVQNGDSSIFAYDYNWLFGIVVGLLMLVIMLFLTVDIAIRAIKLGILRIIAPIPIISYVDPKSAKDGSFNNWLKALISTFLELFIKIAVIYIIIFVIIQLTAADKNFFEASSLTVDEQLYAKVFIIIGLLIFAVQASAFIKNIFGIKDQGMGAGLGMLLGGAGAMLAGGGVAGVAMAMKDGAVDGAQGKSNFGNLNKGKDIASKTAKGKATAQKREQKRNKKLAEKFGFNKEYADADAAATELENRADQAEALASVDGATADQKLEAAKLRQQATQARAAADKVKKFRDDPWSGWAQGNAKEGFTKYHATQFARSVGNAIQHPIQTSANIAQNSINDYKNARDSGANPFVAAGAVLDGAVNRRFDSLDQSEMNRNDYYTNDVKNFMNQANSPSNIGNIGSTKTSGNAGGTGNTGGSGGSGK